MFQDIKDYFKYNSETMHFGIGGYIIFSVMYFYVKEINLWIFLLPLICLAYSGKRFFIILASIGVMAYTFCLYHYGNDTKSERAAIFSTFAYLPYFRDMYFLYKYRLNAFAYVDNPNEDTELAKQFANVYFIILSLICLIIYGLGKWYNW